MNEFSDEKSDSVLHYLVRLRNDMLATLKQIEAGEVQEGATDTAITRQQLRRVIEIYDSAIMRVATQEAQERIGLRVSRGRLS